MMLWFAKMIFDPYLLHHSEFEWDLFYLKVDIWNFKTEIIWSNLDLKQVSVSNLA